MTKSELEMRALCALAVSWLCACSADRSLTADDGVAGATSPVGAAGTSAAGTSAAGTTGAAGTRGVGGATDGGIIDAAAGARGTDAADAGGAGGPFGVVPATFATVEGCSKDGWCWSTPTPQGNPLYSIWGSGASDVWAVGESGSIVHWDGKAWMQVPSGEHGVLRGVWAAGPKDAWAVGDDAAIVHWDGLAWSRLQGVPVMTFHGRTVWGTGPADVWLGGIGASTSAGSRGAIMHWDGGAWSTYETSQPVDTIWGTGPADVWSLGEDQSLFHWDGKTWTEVSSKVLPQVGTAIWGASSKDLWLGARSVARPTHWNGKTIDVGPDPSLVTSPDLDGLWGSSANDVWAVGLDSPDFYGDGGLILHWDGLAWQRMPSTGASHLFSIWGSRSDDVWAVGESGDIVHWNGRAWSAPVGPPRVNLFSLWGSGADDVWAFGYDRAGLGALRWNGQTWAKTELIDAATIGASTAWATAPYAAWGSGRDDVWVAAVDFEPIMGSSGSSSARALFVHWDGLRWSLDATLDPKVAAEMSINSLWGSGPKDVWAVGLINANSLTGAALHWDGTRWSPVTSLSATDLAEPFGSVWGSGPKDVWIGGGKFVHHWDGVSWSRPLSAEDGGSFIVGGSGPSDVWAVTAANDGTAVASHWNGLSWKPLAIPSLISPSSLVAISPTNAWLRGDQAIAHWDGTAWKPSDAGTSLPSSNLWSDGQGVWMIVMRGLIRHP